MSSLLSNLVTQNPKKENLKNSYKSDINKIFLEKPSVSSQSKKEQEKKLIKDLMDISNEADLNSHQALVEKVARVNTLALKVSPKRRENQHQALNKSHRDNAIKQPRDISKRIHAYKNKYSHANSESKSDKLMKMDKMSLSEKVRLSKQEKDKMKHKNNDLEEEYIFQYSEKEMIDIKRNSKITKRVRREYEREIKANLNQLNKMNDESRAEAANRLNAPTDLFFYLPQMLSLVLPH